MSTELCNVNLEGHSHHNDCCENPRTYKNETDFRVEFIMDRQYFLNFGSSVVFNYSS
jgi:hypothetical protein